MSSLSEGECDGEGTNDEELLYASEVEVAAEEESRHFSNVCFSMAHYVVDSLKEVSRVERHFRSLSEDDEALLCEPVTERVERMKRAVDLNQHFLNLVLSAQGGGRIDVDEPSTRTKDTTDENTESVVGDEPVRPKDVERTQPVRSTESGQSKNRKGKGDSKPKSSAQPPGDSHPAGTTEEFRYGPPMPVSGDLSANVPPPAILARNVSRVRSTLRQFVRDWSTEGKAERDAAYGPLIAALEKYLPLAKETEKWGKPPRIVCPGSGLGRLPFEVVSRGYGCQGNEFSYFMLLGSNFVLNCAVPPESCVIQPFVLSTSNRKAHEDHLRLVKVPDVSPGESVTTGIDFSMCAGEFVEVYMNQISQWDGVLTCFFLDTAKNIILYIRTIANILREGGLWANIGPLLYHYAETPHEVSVELSWEEIVPIIKKYFTLVEVEWRDCHYTTNVHSMMQVEYHCVYFVALRNDVAVHGNSNPVF